MVKNRLAEEDIDAIQIQCKEEVWEPFPGITIVAWNLPNGFTISDQSGCIDPSNYDRETGVNICRERLRNKLWELYGFLYKEEFFKGEE